MGNPGVAWGKPGVNLGGAQGERGRAIRGSPGEEPEGSPMGAQGEPGEAWGSLGGACWEPCGAWGEVGGARGSQGEPKEA